MKLRHILGAAALWEIAWWVRRRAARQTVYAEAQARAVALGKPLVVIGAPDSGPTVGPGCGDITVDLATSSCPGAIQADITKAIPLADDSAVVVVLCTLDYVSDLASALAELRRIAGDEIYNVRVEPWTFVAHGIGYEPIKHTLPWANGRLPVLAGFGRVHPNSWAARGGCF